MVPKHWLRISTWGSSFAFCRTALETLDAFAEQLGRRGSNLMANEDVLIQMRLDQPGYGRMCESCRTFD